MADGYRTPCALTCKAYERDARACLDFLRSQGIAALGEIRTPDLRRFLAAGLQPWLNTAEMTARYLFTVLAEAPVALTGREHVVDLPRRDLRCGAIAKRRHDVRAKRAFATLARDVGRAEDALAVAQGGGLGAGDVCEPPHVVVGNLPERHAARAGFLLDALGICRLGHVVGHDLRRGHHRAPLVVGAAEPSLKPLVRA